MSYQHIQGTTPLHNSLVRGGFGAAPKIIDKIILGLGSYTNGNFLFDLTSHSFGNCPFPDLALSNQLFDSEDPDIIYLLLLNNTAFTTHLIKYRISQKAVIWRIDSGNFIYNLGQDKDHIYVIGYTGLIQYQKSDGTSVPVYSTTAINPCITKSIPGHLFYLDSGNNSLYHIDLSTMTGSQIWDAGDGVEDVYYDFRTNTLYGLFSDAVAGKIYLSETNTDTYTRDKDIFSTFSLNNHIYFSTDEFGHTVIYAGVEMGAS